MYSQLPKFCLVHCLSHLLTTHLEVPHLTKEHLIFCCISVDLDFELPCATEGFHVKMEL